MTRSRNGERDFLSRWSRKKQDARLEPEPAPEPPAEAPADPAPEKSEAEILEELGLPDPDTLGPGSDFKAFMAEAVPDWLRRRALRRLWASNPTLANLDMLVDYGEDYTDAATTVGNLQSAYKVGRGYLDKLTEQGEAADAPEADAMASGTTEAESPTDGKAVEASELAAEDAPGETEVQKEPEELPANGARAVAQERQPVVETSAPAPRRRRMRFDFDEI